MLLRWRIRSICNGSENTCKVGVRAEFALHQPFSSIVASRTSHSVWVLYLMQWNWPCEADDQRLWGQQMIDISEGIDLTALPSGVGCVECLAAGQWWLHLRRCAKCGHIGCCDTSPNQHASAHYRETGHFIMASFEPGESWFWDYRKRKAFYGPKLTPPRSRPSTQPAPGPGGSVPADWRDHLNL